MPGRCEVGARFETEIATHEEAVAGIMRGAPAIVGGQYGSGRCVLISPHPESTHAAAKGRKVRNELMPGKRRLRRIIQRAVAYAIQAESRGPR